MSSAERTRRRRLLLKILPLGAMPVPMMHAAAADAPAGNPKAAAYLLAAYAAWFPAGTVFLCVVDPGVGGARPAVVVEADGRRYVGPGNGLFELVRRRAGEALGSTSVPTISVSLLVNLTSSTRRPAVTFGCAARVGTSWTLPGARPIAEKTRINNNAVR